jgi:hypothetical protein
MRWRRRIRSTAAWTSCWRTKLRCSRICASVGKTCSGCALSNGRGASSRERRPRVASCLIFIAPFAWGSQASSRNNLIHRKLHWEREANREVTNKLSSGYKGLGPPQLAASPGGQRGHDNTSYNPHRCADSFRWRLVRQGSLVLGLVSAAAHTAGSDILGGSQRAAPAGVRPDCNVLDRAPRVRANNSSKAIFVTAMWAASIASISSFGRTPSITARAA